MDTLEQPSQCSVSVQSKFKHAFTVESQLFEMMSHFTMKWRKSRMVTLFSLLRCIVRESTSLWLSTTLSILKEVTKCLTSQPGSLDRKEKNSMFPSQEASNQVRVSSIGLDLGPVLPWWHSFIPACNSLTRISSRTTWGNTTLQWISLLRLAYSALGTRPRTELSGKKYSNVWSLNIKIGFSLLLLQTNCSSANTYWRLV